MKLRSLSRLTLLFMLFATPALAVDINTISDLYVFGDSLVDSGNTQNALGGPGITPCAFTGGVPLCDPAPASFGYFDGRFTNGLTGADVLNQAIDGTNSIASTEGGTNYSYGGARALGGSLPDIALQVNTFLFDQTGVADASALYLINVGGNDVRDQVQSVNAGTSTLTDQQVIDNVLGAIAGQVTALQTAGAQHILVNGVGDVGNIPETLSLGTAAVTHGRALSLDLSTQLFAALDASVFTLDAIGLYDAALLNPGLFGLPAGLDVTGSCLTTGTPPNCSGFAFFDTVHPTTALATVLGDSMIAAIPEPGTALLLGLGLMSLSRRSRRENADL